MIAKTAPATKKVAAKKTAIKSTKKIAPVSTAVKVKVAKPIVTTTPLKITKRLAVVRDSFTMTEADHAVLKLCKQDAIAVGRETKKSEVIRAALIHFGMLNPETRLAAYAKLEIISTGRPRKGKKA